MAVGEGGMLGWVGGHVGLGVNSRHVWGAAVGGGGGGWPGGNAGRYVAVSCAAPCHAHTFCICVQHED